MIERTYKCNLCRDEKKPHELIGLHYVGRGWVRRNVSTTENHICGNCYKSLLGIQQMDPIAVLDSGEVK